ncbi:S-layer homology domain-containing protein [Kocuria rhizophila]|nr:S-layer homology domain-containing protein [Kocuria rhizophila]
MTKGEALFLHLHNATGASPASRRASTAPRPRRRPCSPRPRHRRRPRTRCSSDVPKSHVFYSEISWLANKGITRGLAGRHVAWASPCSVIRWPRSSTGWPARLSTPLPRSLPSRMPTSHVFYKDISWMSEQGITRRWHGTFLPRLSRSAAAADGRVLLNRMAGSPAYTAPAKSPFKDVAPTRSSTRRSPG